MNAIKMETCRLATEKLEVSDEASPSSTQHETSAQDQTAKTASSNDVEKTPR